MELDVALVMGLVMTFAGLYYGSRMVLNAKKSSGSTGWPTVPCEIVSSSVKQGTDLNHETPIRTITPEIEYHYQVNGRWFMNDRITNGPIMLMQGNAERLTHKYPAGSTGFAHYNPGDPADAVLESGNEPAALTFSLAIAALFFVVGIIVTAVAIL